MVVLGRVAQDSVPSSIHTVKSDGSQSSLSVALVQRPEDEVPLGLGQYGASPVPVFSSARHQFTGLSTARRSSLILILTMTPPNPRVPNPVRGRQM